MTKLLFDAPLNKKLTESEAVIAALIVEKHRIVVARAKVDNAPGAERLQRSVQSAGAVSFTRTLRRGVLRFRNTPLAFAVCLSYNGTFDQGRT